MFAHRTRKPERLQKVMSDDRRLSNELEYCYREIRRKHFEQYHKQQEVNHQLSTLLTRGDAARMLDDSSIQTLLDILPMRDTTRAMIKYLLEYGEKETCSHYGWTKQELQIRLSVFEHRYFKRRKEVDDLVVRWEEYQARINKLYWLDGYMDLMEDEAVTPKKIGKWIMQAPEVFASGTCWKICDVETFAIQPKRNQYRMMNDFYKAWERCIRDCTKMPSPFLQKDSSERQALLRRALARKQGANGTTS